MKKIPYLFFAFANSPTSYLPNLKKEERGVLSTFRQLKSEGLIDFDHIEQTRPKDMFNMFSQFGDKIQVLHYSGHADSLAMELDESAYSAEQLATLISGWNQLQLVFLNGCSTGEMVDLLLDKGVKAVIATSEKIADNKACDFSIAFYKAFSQKGKPLKVAFTQAISTLKDMPIKEEQAFISRGVRQRKIGQQKEIPWAMYYREEAAAVLDWTLLPAPKVPNLPTSKFPNLFISYNHQDAIFVDELEKYMAANGVYFWRDSRDAPVGRLDKIVLHEMENRVVLLVFSEKSVDSDWVEFEVQNARKLEKVQKRDVLCPITLDTAWKTADWSPILMNQIRKYHILNFSEWKNEVTMERQFEKLLNGLELFYKR